jgi:putative hydrolase of HD superfamily
MAERLDRQIDFVVELNKLKTIVRRTWLPDGSRRENDAEHSWHLAMMAMLLAEYVASDRLDLLRVLKMLLVHDVVEIDAGDTFAYDDAAAADKPQREQAAATRLFGMLPPDQGKEMRELWDEFETRRTPEARFAAALDRLQPILLNYYSHGKAWQEHGITSDQVVARNRHMSDGAPQLWQFARALIDSAVEEGYLAPGLRGNAT